MDNKRLNAPALLENAVEGLTSREQALALKWGVLGFMINKGASDDEYLELMENIQAQAYNLRLLKEDTLL